MSLWSEMGGRNEQIHEVSLAIPGNGTGLGSQAGGQDQTPPTTARCHLPHREALKQGEGFRFWNEGQRLMVKPASFLSFSFPPSCSQELTLGGSRCLTELLYAKLCAALEPPQCWEGQMAWHSLHLLINAQLSTAKAPWHGASPIASLPRAGPRHHCL